MTSADIGILEGPHVISIILYLYAHPGCSRTDIYTNVARGDRMPAKIDRLISKGIIEDLSKECRRSSLVLTPVGGKVADRLQSIVDLLS